MRAKMRAKMRAEQSRAEQSRAEQSRTEQSRAEQSKATQSYVFLVGVCVGVWVCVPTSGAPGERNKQEKNIFIKTSQHSQNCNVKQSQTSQTLPRHRPPPPPTH
eukprot:793463-Rhodomonas_salina.1